MAFKELIGKKVIGLSISEKDTILRFDLEEKKALFDGEAGNDLTEHFYSTEGDCCADAFFYHISNLDALIDGTVVSIDGEKETVSPYYDGDYSDCTPYEHYLHWSPIKKDEDKSSRGKSHKDNENGNGIEESGFWRIHTDKGTCTIEARNSHNGYYGASVYKMKHDDVMARRHYIRTNNSSKDEYILVNRKWRELKQDM